MSENVRLYATILSGFERVLREVPDDAWNNPSPCEGWTARDVAGHAMGVVHNIAARGGIGTLVDPFDNVGAIAGNNPAITFEQIHQRYVAAIDQPDALQILVKSRLGDFTLDEYIGEMCSDTLVHTWDVARAAGLDDTLDAEAVGIAYASYLERDPGNMRAPGRYADAIEAGTTAQDRLIAFTGRDPNWT